MTPNSKTWPELSAVDLQPTIGALHLWSQIVGKVRLMMTPWLNHSWHVPFYVSARGLTTGLIPGIQRSVEFEFNLIDGFLVARDTCGFERQIALKPQSVAVFYASVMQVLSDLHIDIHVYPVPCELPDAIPFPSDDFVRNYDGDVARAYWQSLLQTLRVFQIFRTRFVGKCSPVHLFWGSFDLAVTRFSGRAAPRHPGGMLHVSDAVARDAYNQEVSSAGFWPGIGSGRGPCYYSYVYPAPVGFGKAKILPAAACFDEKMGEFLLPYQAVRESADPDDTLLGFLQSTYEAAANLSSWNRTDLERQTGPIGKPPAGV